MVECQVGYVPGSGAAAADAVDRDRRLRHVGKRTVDHSVADLGREVEVGCNDVARIDVPLEVERADTRGVEIDRLADEFALPGIARGQGDGRIPVDTDDEARGRIDVEASAVAANRRKVGIDARE